MSEWRAAGKTADEVGQRLSAPARPLGDTLECVGELWEGMGAAQFALEERLGELLSALHLCERVERQAARAAAWLGGVRAAWDSPPPPPMDEAEAAEVVRDAKRVHAEAVRMAEVAGSLRGLEAMLLSDAELAPRAAAALAPIAPLGSAPGREGCAVTAEASSRLEQAQAALDELRASADETLAFRAALFEMAVSTETASEYVSHPIPPVDTAEAREALVASAEATAAKLRAPPPHLPPALNAQAAEALGAWSTVLSRAAAAGWSDVPVGDATVSATEGGSGLEEGGGTQAGAAGTEGGQAGGNCAVM